MAELKKCRTCEIDKSIYDFYSNKTYSCGLFPDCKKCYLQKVTAYNKTPAGRLRAKKYNSSQKGKDSHKKYSMTAKGRLVRKKAKIRYYSTDYGKAARVKNVTIGIKRYPERNKARAKVRYLALTGKIPQATSLKCLHCPSQAAHYHHHNGYAPEHETDVIPLCVSCHVKAHSIVSEPTFLDVFQLAHQKPQKAALLHHSRT